jgi:hypothetical protein
VAIRSSTSSSERAGPAASSRGGLPWAALLALAVVLLLDRSVFQSQAVWTWLDSRLLSSHLLEQGLTQDRIALLDVQDGNDAPRIVLVGSSRMNRGFRPDEMPSDSIPRAHFIKLAHPQFFPFEMRSATDDILAASPRVVVLALSELETHTRLKLVPGSSFGSGDAVLDLIREAGPGFAFENRVMLRRIALEGAFETYHDRGVLDAAIFAPLHRFERNARLKPSRHPDRSLTFLGGERKEIDFGELNEIVADFDARFPGRGSIIKRAQFGLVRSISAGAHADINLALLRRSVETLRDNGAQVILVEPPIYPGAQVLYDGSTRDEFLRFSESLVREHGIVFVPLEAQPVYLNEDFGDLTHLDQTGALKFTRVVLDAIRAALLDLDTR